MLVLGVRSIAVGQRTGKKWMTKGFLAVKPQRCSIGCMISAIPLDAGSCRRCISRRQFAILCRCSGASTPKAPPHIDVIHGLIDAAPADASKKNFQTLEVGSPTQITAWGRRQVLPAPHHSSQDAERHCHIIHYCGRERSEVATSH